MINYIVISFVVFPILMGLIQYIVKRFDFKSIGLAVQLLMLALSVYVLLFTNFKDGIIVNLIDVSRPVGMALKVDSLSMTMILLNNLIFLLMSYASYHRSYYNKLFIFLIMALQGLINGIFLSTDFFNIYLLIELSTIIVSILVMYKKDGRSLYDGMLYLLVNMVGMAFFLFGIGYIYKIFGVLDFESVQEMITLIPKKSLILPFAFLMTGASLKSAFMPLFSWLPKAHGTASAPTMVSAILSGIFVKTGIYLFIRIADIFGPVINLNDLFLVVAIVTAILGAVFAMSNRDIKLIMSYSTISQVGIIMLGLNNVSVTGYTGGLFYLFNHGMFKVLMFFIIGILIKTYRTRDIMKMGSLWQSSKVLSFGLIIGLLSLTGMPLLGSGIGKYMIGEYYKTDLIKVLFMVLTVTSSLYCIPLFKILLPGDKKHKVMIKKNQKNTILILSFALITLGSIYRPILDLVYDYQITINIIRVGGKLVEYSLLLFLSFMIHFVINKWTGIKEKIEKFDLSFNAINMAILSYFVMLTIAAQLYK